MNIDLNTQLSQVVGVQELQEFRSSDNTLIPCKSTGRGVSRTNVCTPETPELLNYKGKLSLRNLNIINKVRAKAMMAVALLLCCACSGSSDEGGGVTPPTPVDDGTISFTTAIDQTTTVTRVTTGPVNSVTDLQNLAEGFGVFGYLTDLKTWTVARGSYAVDAADYPVPDFMNNQPVTWGWLNTVTKVNESGVTVVDEDKSTKGWTYQPPKYWPNYSSNDDSGEKAPRYISFFAYAPFTDQSELGTENITALPDATDKSPHVHYTLGPANYQTDLLWANCFDAKRNGQGLIEVNDDGTIKQYQKVPLQFHHALSCVELYVQRIYDEQTYSGKEPSTNEQQTKLFVGKLSLAASPALKTSGILHLDVLPGGDGLWTYSSADDAAAETPRDYTETMFDTHVGGTAESNLSYIRSAELSKWERDGYGVDDEERQLLASKTLMFFPQTVTLTPTLTFSMITRDNELTQNTVTDSDGLRFSRILNEVTGNSVKITFAPGKKYKLVIHIAVEHIELEVAGVEDWDFPMHFHTTVDDYTPQGYNKTLNEED